MTGETAMNKQDFQSQIQAICKGLQGFTGYKLIFKETYCAILGETTKRFSLTIQVLYGDDMDLVFHGMTGITELGVLKELERKIQERSEGFKQERIIEQLEKSGSL